MSANPTFFARGRGTSRRLKLEPEETGGACRGGRWSTGLWTGKWNHHSRKPTAEGWLCQSGSGAICSPREIGGAEPLEPAASNISRGERALSVPQDYSHRFQQLGDGERLWQQPADFEPMVNSHQYLREIERFADEILRPGFQCAQLVIRLGGDHENRKIAVGFDCLQALHHLESIQAGHLKVEPDQGMAVLAVQLADLVRIPR